jgi:hypothetical protein
VARQLVTPARGPALPQGAGSLTRGRGYLWDMSNPQQPELARSRKTPAQDQDAVATVLDGQRDVGADAPRGPVPVDNQPGHHPAEEQDKPDLDAFAAKLGIAEPPEAGSDNARPAAPAGRTLPTGPAAIAGAVAAVLAIVAAVLAVRRRRSRR